MEALNEYIIFMFTVFMVTYTEFGGDPENQEIIGWWLISMFILGMLINITIIGKITIRKSWLECYGAYYVYT